MRDHSGVVSLPVAHSESRIISLHGPRKYPGFGFRDSRSDQSIPQVLNQLRLGFCSMAEIGIMELQALDMIKLSEEHPRMSNRLHRFEKRLAHKTTQIA